MTDLATTLRTLLARRSPVVTDDDVAAARELVRLALERAEADHAAFAARSTKAPETRRLARVGALASKAAAGDAAALARLLAEIGDGAAIDEAIARGAGGMVAGFTNAASNLARAEPRHARCWAGQVATACDMAVTSAPRRRRGRRFFAVLALAFVYCDLTGDTPTFTTAEEIDERGRGEWRRTGAFAEFVEAADIYFDFSEGKGLEAAISDALRVGRAELFIHLTTPGRPWPAPYGSPLFVREASDDEAAESA